MEVQVLFLAPSLVTQGYAAAADRTDRLLSAIPHLIPPLPISLSSLGEERVGVRSLPNTNDSPASLFVVGGVLANAAGLDDPEAAVDRRLLERLGKSADQRFQVGKGRSGRRLQDGDP